MNDRRERARSLSRRMEALILALTGVVILFVAYGLWMTWDDPDWVGQFIANPDGVTSNGRISTMNQQQDPTVIVTEPGCPALSTRPA